MITLGSLIKALEAVTDKALPITIGGAPISRIASWRGSYDELTVVTSGCNDIKTVDDLLAAAKAAVGATFDGYKGGEYRMRLNTPIHGDDWGAYSDIGIDGVGLDGDSAFLILNYPHVDAS